MSIKEIEKTDKKVEDKTVKEIVRALLDRLPDDVTWERLHYHLHVCQVVCESEKEMEQNGAISDETARERLKRWLD